MLALHPEMGQRVKTKRFGQIRRHVSGHYLIYYREITDGIEILLLTHGARDQGELL